MGGSSGAIRAGKAFVEFTLRDAALRKGLKKWQGRFRAFGASLTNIGRMVAGVGAGIGAGFVLPNKAASDLQETMNKFNVVFGENAGEVKAWSDKFAGTIGRSQKQVADFMANTQDLFVPLGFEPGAATEMSKQITGLAFDLASFNNTADEDAIRDLHAALTGSGEVMKKYGVVLSEAAVKQELLNRGIDDKKATNQQKVMARMNIILAGTTAAQGDAIRSADGFANQLKGLKGVAFDTAAAIGNAILPVATEFITRMRAAVVVIREWVANNPRLIQGIAVAGVAIAAAGAVLMGLGVAFTVAGVAAGVLSTVIGAVGAVLGFILSPIGFAIAAVAGIVLWFTNATTAGRAMVENLRGWFRQLAKTVGQTFKAVGTALAGGDIVAAGKVLWAGLKLAWLQGTENLRVAWASFKNDSIDIMTDLVFDVQSIWVQMIGGMRIAWADFATKFKLSMSNLGTDIGNKLDTWGGWFEKTFGGLDERGKLEVDLRVARINAKRAGEAAENQRELRGDLDAKLAAIVEERKAKLQAIEDSRAIADSTREDQKKRDIAAAQSAADKAQKAWEQQRDAIAGLGDANELRKTKDAELGKQIDTNMGGALGKTRSLGTFSADAIISLQGGGAEEETAENTKEMKETLKRIERKPAGGALTAH